MLLYINYTAKVRCGIYVLFTVILRIYDENITIEIQISNEMENLAIHKHTYLQVEDVVLDKEQVPSNRQSANRIYKSEE